MCPLPIRWLRSETGCPPGFLPPLPHLHAESRASTDSSASHMCLDSPSPALGTGWAWFRHSGPLPCPWSPHLSFGYILCPAAGLTFLTSFRDDDILMVYKMTSNLHLTKVLSASALSLYCPNTPHPPEQVSIPLQAGCFLFGNALPCWYTWQSLSHPTSSDQGASGSP